VFARHQTPPFEHISSISAGGGPVIHRGFDLGGGIMGGGDTPRAADCSRAGAGTRLPVPSRRSKQRDLEQSFGAGALKCSEAFRGVLVASNGTIASSTASYEGTSARERPTVEQGRLNRSDSAVKMAEGCRLSIVLTDDTMVVVGPVHTGSRNKCPNPF
jgi:hypothetical protein